MLSEAVKTYLRAVAEKIIDDVEDAGEEKDAAWERLTKQEQDVANEIVEAVFDPWL